eukprot:8364251-Alexandrium_andersonii.AAC.1
MFPKSWKNGCAYSAQVVAEWGCLVFTSRGRMEAPILPQWVRHCTTNGNDQQPPPQHNIAHEYTPVVS